MTDKQLEKLIIKAVKEDDKLTIYTIIRGLQEATKAKYLLRNVGYGWFGLNILETVKLILKEKSRVQFNKVDDVIGL